MAGHGERLGKHAFDQKDLKKLGLAFYELLYVGMKTGARQGTWTRQDGSAGPHFTKTLTFFLLRTPEQAPDRADPAKLGIAEDVEEIKASPEYQQYGYRIPKLMEAVKRAAGNPERFPSEKYFKKL